MSLRLRLAGLMLGAMLAGGGPATAQVPGPPLAMCEDQLRVARIFADAVLNARTRQELEAAQALAALLKQLDALRAEVAELRKKVATPPKE